MLTNRPIPPPPDDASAPWMPIARAEIGIHELTDAGDLNPRVREYFGATTYPPSLIMRTTAWCAAYLSWCLVRAHVPSPHTANAAKCLTFGHELASFRYGCIVVIDRGDHAHVCFGIDEQGTEVLTLDGNSNNRVRYASHEKRDVLGLRWPYPLISAH